MQKIIHRINTIEQLKDIPRDYGVEVDVRAYHSTLILNHEPYVEGVKLDEYLKHFRHAFIIFNIKEAGIEFDVLTLAKKHNIRDFFLLDVEFPFLFKAARQGIKNLAVRLSEDESVETVKKYKGLIDWVWIDTMTRLPLSKRIITQLEGFKTCLVCPERWGRPQDIQKYKKVLKKHSFNVDAVMTSLPHVDLW